MSVLLVSCRPAAIPIICCPFKLGGARGDITKLGVTYLLCGIIYFYTVDDFVTDASRPERPLFDIFLDCKLLRMDDLLFTGS